MNYIVLVKQVPDIRNIPDEAWDWEKGTLKRAFLTNVLNELDKQALAMAVRMRDIAKAGTFPSANPLIDSGLPGGGEGGRQDGRTAGNGQIVALTMGPPFAEEVLRYAMSVGADAGVLVTDRKMGGADTAATAYPLGQSIRKIEKEIFNGDRNYIILSGMQSVDGDTAQVPAQVAEEMGIAQIAYATAVNYEQNQLRVTRITRRGNQVVAPITYPCLVTVVDWTEPLNASFSRTRWAAAQKLYTWSAADIDVDESRIGQPGSRTTVFRIFSPKEEGKQCAIFAEDNLDKLLASLKEAYARKAEAAKPSEEAAYQFTEGKTGSYKGEVWVYIEQEEGEINSASLELLGKGTELARQLKEKTGVVIVGSASQVKDKAKELFAYGADKVYEAEHPLLEDFLPVPYGKVVSELVEKFAPQMMLFSATPMGRELAPRVAYHANSGLTADCTALDIMDFKRGNIVMTAVLKQTRPALGGNIMASIITQNSKIQMATARPGVMKALKPDYSRTGELIQYNPDLKENDMGVKIFSMESRPPPSELKDAVLIVAGGLGCKTKEAYDKYIRTLAESMGKFLRCEAMVGASRLAVEAGFIDRAHQVGQTGQTVKPRLYVAVGISGAVQHLSGMQKSELVLVVNKDPNAPIFKVADIGVVGNIENIVPKLIAELNKDNKQKNKD